ncbi:MAG: hypothetical protein HUK01_10880 [Bacteroidaceae bacterium]|nr:hypothetical protein [Bacteroidaceae bacterium]
MKKYQTPTLTIVMLATQQVMQAGSERIPLHEGEGADGGESLVRQQETGYDPIKCNWGN